MMEMARRQSLRRHSRGHLRHLSQALAAQVHPDNYSLEEAHEIERLFHEQMEWLHAQERDLLLVR